MASERREIFSKGVKVAVSVFITIVILKLIFNLNPFYASIAAVSCLQGTIKDSVKVGIERTMGTIFGGAVGLGAILIIGTESKDFLSSLVISGAMLLIVLGCKYILKKPASSTIACIVFLGIATNMEGRDPYYWAGMRTLTTVIGVIAAVLVNWLLSGEYRRSRVYLRWIRRKF